MTGISDLTVARSRTHPQDRIRKGAAVLVIAVVAVIAAAGFAVLLAAVLLVTIGVHQEEKRLTFARRRGPTGVARVARRIVGRYVRPAEPEPNVDTPESRGAMTSASPGESGASGRPQSRGAA
jgi:hypothetical protein